MPADHPGLERPLGAVQVLLGEGQYRAALDAALQLHSSYPGALGPVTLAARASLELGDLQRARNLALEATRLRPRNVASRILYAQALVRSGRAAEAFALLKGIEESALHRPGALRRLARFHRQFGQNDDAYRVTLRAMESDPDDADTVYHAALLARKLGRASEAMALCRRLLSLEPDHTEGCLLRSVLQAARPQDHHLEALGFLLDAHPDPGPERAGLCQALGRELEDLAQFEAAFTSYVEAARLRESGPGTQQLLDAAAIEKIEKSYQLLTASTTAAGADVELQDTFAGELFLLGLPCAGFDGFRRWLGAQAGIHSVGGADPLCWFVDRPGAKTTEQRQPLNADHVQRFAANCKEFMHQRLASESHWQLHDSPGFFVHFGLLRRALPAARFIHLRRDPLDQCMDLFCAGPGEVRLPADSLDAICEHYTAYHRLMGFSRRYFPGAMLEIDYELFVAEPERVWGSICRFLALEPQDLLPAKKLVGEREDERVGRARHFGEALETLARRLRANGVPVS